MPKKNYMLDRAFTVVSDRDFEELTQTEVICGILTRVQSLLKCWEPDAIGWVDEYEEEG